MRVCVWEGRDLFKALGVEHSLCASRVVWAGGVAAAVALSCSSVGAVLAEHLVDSHAGLWEAASAVLEAALSNQAYLTESIQALDAWSADTGRPESDCQLCSSVAV